MHPSIPPSVPSAYPFIPHPSIQLPIRSSTIHSLSSHSLLSIRHAFIHPPLAVHHYPYTHAPSTHAFGIYPSVYHPPTISHQPIHLTIILLPSFLMPVWPPIHTSTVYLFIHLSIHYLFFHPSSTRYLSITCVLSTLRGARCSSALRESPVCWGRSGAGKCALSPWCPHREFSGASSVASRAGKGSKMQHPQAGRRERAISWVS